MLGDKKGFNLKPRPTRGIQKPTCEEDKSEKIPTSAILERPVWQVEAPKKEVNFELGFQKLLELLNHKFQAIKDSIRQEMIEYPEEIKVEVEVLLALINNHSNDGKDKDRVSVTYRDLVSDNLNLPLSNNDEDGVKLYTAFVNNLRKIKHYTNQQLLLISEVEFLIHKGQRGKIEHIGEVGGVGKDFFDITEMTKNLTDFDQKINEDLCYANSRLEELEKQYYVLGHSVDAANPVNLIQNNAINYSVMSPASVNTQTATKEGLKELEIGNNAETRIIGEMSNIKGVVMGIIFPSNTVLDCVLKVDALVLCSDKLLETSKVKDLMDLILTISNYFYVQSLMNDRSTLKDTYEKKRLIRQRNQKKEPEEDNQDGIYENGLRRILSMNANRLGRLNNSKVTSDTIAKLDSPRTFLEQSIDPEHIALPDSLDPYSNPTIIYQGGKPLEINQKELIDEMILLIEQQKKIQTIDPYIFGLIREFNKLLIDTGIRVVPIQAKANLGSSNRGHYMNKIECFNSRTKQNIAGLVALNDGSDNPTKRTEEYSKFLGF